MLADSLLRKNQTEQPLNRFFLNKEKTNKQKSPTRQQQNNKNIEKVAMIHHVSFGCLPMEIWKEAFP